MPTDYAKLSENLGHFYEFTGKVVLYVGAAGRQLLDPATATKKLVAIDRDVAGLRVLQSALAAQGTQDAASREFFAGNFEQVAVRGDVVYFEFCLHETEDPAEALAHAKSLASDIVVFDHSPGSEWSYYCAEEDKVARSFAAMERFGIRHRATFHAEQRFGTLAELLAKVAPQGEPAIARAEKFAGVTPIVIPMEYELDLL